MPCGRHVFLLGAVEQTKNEMIRVHVCSVMFISVPLPSLRDKSLLPTCSSTQLGGGFYKVVHGSMLIKKRSRTREL